MQYNKLVRDKIPDIITASGSIPVIRILDDQAYKQALQTKLQEEIDEFIASSNIEELADILEVVYTLANYYDTSQSQLEHIRQQKHEQRGGFDQKIFLIETT